MDDIRRKALLAHKEHLEEQPFNAEGYRYGIVGTINMLFGEDYDEIGKGIKQLKEDMDELGMTLAFHPHRPNFLCIVQKRE